MSISFPRLWIIWGQVKGDVLTSVIATPNTSIHWWPPLPGSSQSGIWWLRYHGCIFTCHTTSVASPWLIVKLGAQTLGRVFDSYTASWVPTHYNGPGCGTVLLPSYVDSQPQFAVGLGTLPRSPVLSRLGGYSDHGLDVQLGLIYSGCFW